MQEAMRGPIFRTIFSFGYEIALVVFLAPTLSVILEKPMYIMGGVALLFGLIVIPLNYLYNLIFDQQLQRLNKPLYQRSFGLRLFHAVLYEVIILIIAMPMVMHFLNFSFAQALILNLSIAAVVPVYTIFVNWAFDAY